MENSVNTLYDLFSVPRSEFVANAYKILLTREPDSEGLGFYQGLLLSGSSRLDILNQIVLSKEGQRKAVKISGLDTLLKQYRRCYKSPMGFIYRLIYNKNIQSLYASEILSGLVGGSNAVSDLSVILSKISTEGNNIPTRLEVSLLSDSSVDQELETENEQNNVIHLKDLGFTFTDFRARELFNKLEGYC